MVFSLYFRKRSKLKKAFSFIEIAIVILVIGILIAGVIVAKNLQAKAQIQSANALTRSSPIRAIRDNIFWTESSITENNSWQSLEDGDSISNWKNISVINNKTLLSKVGNGPVYSNGINNIPAVKFSSNSSNDYFLIQDASFLNSTDYTIFILDKRINNNPSLGNYLLGQSGSFSLGYQSETAVIQSHGETASSNNEANIVGLSDYSGPRVFTFMHSSVVGNKIYINSNLANQDNTSTAKAHLSGLATLPIGKGYNGEIGELVIFIRALNDSERSSIEEYLMKKWNVSTNIASPKCVANGVVGISDGTSLPSGTSTISCNAAGYIGTLNYTCNSLGDVTVNNNSCSVATCSGGSESTISSGGNNYKVHVFTASGNINCPSSVNAEVLVVAGGGGGGFRHAGGGGAGGFLTGNVNISATVNHTVTVGKGGNGSATDTSSRGSNGENSSFESYIAIGGGGGGTNGYSGNSGGSGGGGSNGSSGGNGTSGQGNKGGDQNNGNGCCYAWGNGGGGASSAGTNSSGNAGSGGGNGSSSSITGNLVYYAGGGGGGNGSGNSTVLSGGTGGGGNGGTNGIACTNGTNGTGGGGGGGGAGPSTQPGCKGGSGIVVIRYKTN